MSYLQEFKERIQEEKEVKVEKYKQFMEDFVLEQATLSSTGNVIVNYIQFKDQFRLDDFKAWLEEEGFKVEDLNHTQLNIVFEE